MINESKLVVCGVNYCTSLYLHNLLRTDYAKTRKIVYDKVGNLSKMLHEFKDVKKCIEPKNSLLLFESLGSLNEPTVLIINGLDKCHTHVLQFLQDIIDAKAKLKHEIILIATVPSLDNKKLKKQIDNSGVFSKVYKLKSEDKQFVLKSVNTSDDTEILPMLEWRLEYSQINKITNKR